MCMNPPMVCEETRPSTHRMISIIAMVSSIFATLVMLSRMLRADFQDRSSDEMKSSGAPFPTQRLIREIFVPSMLRLAMSPCWSKMKA
jgi:hypothetical protein